MWIQSEINMKITGILKNSILDFKQLFRYDILTCHALLCITVGMMSLHIMHVSNYTGVNLMTVKNANF
jgi:hypothetical protein